MRKFLREELAKYNGKKGAPAYVAYDGLVYDVSDSLLWTDGDHLVFHKAGQDLTDSFEHAPHGADLLDKFPVVGSFEK